MPRKPQSKADDPAQFKRFVKTAREIGADEDPKAFDRVFKKIVRKKRNEGAKTQR